MPVTQNTQFQANGFINQKEPKSLDSLNFDSEYRQFYPDGGNVNLHPASETSKRLVAEIMSRAQESERVMKRRHRKLDRIDETLTAFIPTDILEDKKKLADDRTPISIVVPESYATLETFLTYYMGVFGGNPMFKYEGSGPEDLIGGMMMEMIIANQTGRKNALLTLMTQWRDAVAYGFGVVHVEWIVQAGKKTNFEPIVDIDPITREEFSIGFDRVVVDTIQYEGNILKSIDPRKYLPDPTVPIYDPQAGEYVMWAENAVDFMVLRRREAQPGSDIFNVKYLENLLTRSSIYSNVNFAREAENTRSSTQDTKSPGGSHPIDIIWGYIDLIPRDWKIGTSDEPQKWMFGLANDEVIVALHPMELHHNMFPVAVAAPEAGGHELITTSRLETIFGLQEVINFKMNADVKETINFLQNKLIVDPKRIHLPDVLNHSNVIRLRKPAWGRGVGDAIEQLKLQSTTDRYMNDIVGLQQLSRSGSGATDALQGIQRTSGERITKDESSATRGAALSRLQKSARMISMQSMAPIGLMYAYHTQQFMSDDTFVKTAGRWQQVLAEEFNITDRSVLVMPLDLSIDFDIIISDGSISSGESPADWIQWFGQIAAAPEVRSELDMVSIALHIATLMGNKTAHNFRRRPVRAEVVPDDQALEAEAVGELQRV